MIEAGVKGYEDVTWMGMFAPAGMPAAALTKLRADVHDVVAQPDIRQRFDAAGMLDRVGDANEMRDVVAPDPKNGPRRWPKSTSLSANECAEAGRRGRT